MNILRYNQLEITQEFIKLLNSPILESNDIIDAENTFIKDLKFIKNLTLTFGAGISSMIETVTNLVKNGNLNVPTDKISISLFIIAALSICVLEESRGNKVVCTSCLGKSCGYCINGYITKTKATIEIKSILEELQLRGIGNGLVKILCKIFESIYDLFKTIVKQRTKLTNSILDMFSYTAISVPILNTVSILVNHYDLNMNTFMNSFASITLGIATLALKHGVNYIYNILKNKLSKKDEDSDEQKISSINELIF